MMMVMMMIDGDDDGGGYDDDDDNNNNNNNHPHSPHTQDNSRSEPSSSLRHLSSDFIFAGLLLTLTILKKNKSF